MSAVKTIRNHLLIDLVRWTRMLLPLLRTIIPPVYARGSEAETIHNLPSSGRRIQKECALPQLRVNSPRQTVAPLF